MNLPKTEAWEKEFEHKFFMWDDVNAFLDTALDRIAAETKKAIVPDQELLPTLASDPVWHFGRGHNSCRSQMEANYQSWTKKV